MVFILYFSYSPHLLFFLSPASFLCAPLKVLLPNLPILLGFWELYICQKEDSVVFLSSSPWKGVCSLCMWKYDYSRLQLIYFPLPFLLRWHPSFRWLQPDAFPRYWQYGMDEHAYMWHLVFCIIIVAMIALYSFLLIDSRLTFSFSLGWTVVEVNIYSTLY